MERLPGERRRGLQGFAHPMAIGRPFATIAQLRPRLFRESGHSRSKAPIYQPDPLGLKKDLCDYEDPTNKRVIDFINANLPALQAQIQAASLGVNPLFVLGLSGSESRYGTSRVAILGNNYFGIQPMRGYPSVAIPLKNSNRALPFTKFLGPQGIGPSAVWFLRRYGPQVAGAGSPEAFVADLNAGPNQFNASEAKFPSSTISAIQAILNRINCPAVKKNPPGKQDSSSGGSATNGPGSPPSGGGGQSLDELYWEWLTLQDLETQQVTTIITYKLQ